jgi:hypothetical protein
MDNLHKLTGNNNPSPLSTDGSVPDVPVTPNVEIPPDLLINAALLFDGSWQNTEAADLRLQLLTFYFGGIENIPPEYFFFPQAHEQSNGLLNQTLDTLINLAKDHPNFENFRTQPEQFWDQVRQISEVRVIETYVNGKSEARAVSRYGELLNQLNRSGEYFNNSGHQSNASINYLDNFLASLPPNERNVFQARQQIHQTFGANELFVGNGIALDDYGNFPVRVFFSNNGKNPELAPHSVLSLLNGNVSDKEFALLQNASLFANGQILFSAKSAALLSLSLAFYQNINALLSLEDVAMNSLMPKNPNVASEQILNKFINQTVADNVRFNFRSAESLVIAAFISGALATIDRFTKFGRGEISNRTGFNEISGEFGFSAGATGAMMGATIGCVAPLAEKSIGEILGFTASVVVGLTESGLRTLGANVLISIIKTGIQNILDAASVNQSEPETDSPNKLLTAPEAVTIFENDLRRRLFKTRLRTLSTA